MNRNVGKLDRTLRIVMGAALLSLAFVGPHTPFGFIGLIPLLSGLMGFCAMYKIFGLSTCPLHAKH